MVKHLLANFSVDTVQVLDFIGVAVAVAVVNTLGIDMVAKVQLVYRLSDG